MFSKQITIFWFSTMLFVCYICPVATSQTKRTPNKPVYENAPQAIKQLCYQGAVMVWKYDTGKIIYELRTSRRGNFTGKYDYRNADGEHIGYANYSDTPIELSDGSYAFCSYNGRACPRYLQTLCPLTEKSD